MVHPAGLAALSGPPDGSVPPRLRSLRLNVEDIPSLKERILEMRREGRTLQAVADQLNEEGVPTIRGGQLWRPSSVQAALGYRRPRRRREEGGHRM